MVRRCIVPCEISLAAGEACTEDDQVRTATGSSMEVDKEQSLEIMFATWNHAPDAAPRTG